MQGQMTIFEFLPQEADFVTIPEAQVMEIISQRIGVKLTWDSHLKEYQAKVGKVKITAEIDTYSCTHEGSETLIEGHKFIGAGWGMSTEGGGRPCDSIDEAVEYLQKALSKGARHEKHLSGRTRTVQELPA
jgi:hypothetical protein